jgi:hypothetical protein
MAQAAHDAFSTSTLATSFLPAQQTPEQAPSHRGGIQWRTGHGPLREHDHTSGWKPLRSSFSIDSLGSTGKGILIGMLSAFGSAALVALIMAIVYFFRYTNRGRIFLDRIGRPGEYDDEQQFLREEEEAMADMDEMQRQEYLRAKGRWKHSWMG